MTLHPPVPGLADDPQVLQPAAAVSSNGSPFGGPSRLPRGQHASKALRWILPGGAAVLIAVAIVIWFFWFRGPQLRTDLEIGRVEYKDLQLKVVERGALEARENRDVKCEVKAGSRGAPKIKWVVDNGAMVQKGDLLVDIDASYLEEQAQSKKIDRDKAETDKIAAEQLYPVKKIAIALAHQNLEKWIKGDF